MRRLVASAFVVMFGRRGRISEKARYRRQSRQSTYRESDKLIVALKTDPKPVYRTVDSGGPIGLIDRSAGRSRPSALEAGQGCPGEHNTIRMDHGY